jgi:hypothetical protein
MTYQIAVIPPRQYNPEIGNTLLRYDIKKYILDAYIQIYFSSFFGDEIDINTFRAASHDMTEIFNNNKLYELNYPATLFVTENGMLWLSITYNPNLSVNIICQGDYKATVICYNGNTIPDIQDFPTYSNFIAEFYNC